MCAGSTYIQNRVFFLNVNSSLRTNDSIRNKIDEDKHKRWPLDQLSINVQYAYTSCIMFV